MDNISKTNLEYLKKVRKVYFVAMKEEIDPSCTSSEVVFTGVGKARATRGLLRWIIQHHDDVESWRKNIQSGESCDAPLIVSIGTAGSGKHKRGEVILVDRFVNNGDSFIREKLCFNELPEPTGHVCASSDFFISDKNFDAEQVAQMRAEFDCMDMESFALANICSVYGLPFLGIKCISDGADDTVESFDEMLPRFRAILNNFVSELE